MLVAVGVGIDNAFDTFTLGVLPVAPIQVKAMRVGIEFNPCAGFCTGIDDGLLV